MAKTINILDSYEEGSARDRAELIYSHYCSFTGILDDCKTKLIYEIQAEEQFSRSHHRDELGVRIQNLGHHSDPTAQQAVNNVILEESIDGSSAINLSNLIPKEAQERIKRKHRVLVVMREEFAAFDKHLYTLMPEEQRIIIPLLNHSKNYNQLSDETGISLEALRKRASRIHKDFIEDMTAYFIDKI